MHVAETDHTAAAVALAKIQENKVETVAPTVAAAVAAQEVNWAEMEGTEESTVEAAAVAQIAILTPQIVTHPAGWVESMEETEAAQAPPITLLAKTERMVRILTVSM